MITDHDLELAKPIVSTEPLPPPLPSFTSPGGRSFTISPGEHWERYPGDTLWHDAWPVLLDGTRAGKLYRSLSYGLTAEGLPRWQASTRELFWGRNPSPPTGIGFDVAGLDSVEEAVETWGRSADQILDWWEGKTVHSIYANIQRRT